MTNRDMDISQNDINEIIKQCEADFFYGFFEVDTAWEPRQWTGWNWPPEPHWAGFRLLKDA